MEKITINQPLQMHRALLNNRLVMPPMATGKADVDGHVTDEIPVYYADRAGNNCVGLVITEHSYIAPIGKAHDNQVSISRDEDVAGLSKITEKVHAKGGTKIVAQISHAGLQAVSETPIGPSNVQHPKAKRNIENIRVMDTVLIDETIQQFVLAALRAQKAGFDGVEIHCAHGYLLNQFFSPLTNHRTDAYGSSCVENRIRLAVETVRAVRKAVGEKMLVGVRLGGCDYMDGGSTVQDCAAVAAILAGEDIDFLDLSGGMCGYMNPYDKTPGYFRELGIAAKKVSTLPVIVTGGIQNAEQAQELLDIGAADLIGIGRALMRDPHCAEKILRD